MSDPLAPDLSRPIERVSYFVDRKFAGIRLDRFLHDKLPWRSRTGVQKLIDEGRILRQIPGDSRSRAASRPAARLVAGETITFLVPEKPDLSPVPEASTEISIVYEDRYLLAVDKPPYLAVHPTARYRKDTLIGQLHRRYRRHEDPSRDVVPKLCHRIDRETSGLVLAAKEDIVRSKLGKIFEGRKVEKEYLAIVQGEVEDERGKVDLPLAPHRKSQVQIRIEARHDGKGWPSVTEYEVRERFRGFTLVAAKPWTGRQHQIRVHLAAIGHPIVGDKIYGPDEGFFLKSLESRLTSDDLRLLGMGRQALHAHRLRLEHPVEKRQIEFIAPLPEDMKDFLSGLKMLTSVRRLESFPGSGKAARSSDSGRSDKKALY